MKKEDDFTAKSSSFFECSCSVGHVRGGRKLVIWLSREIKHADQRDQGMVDVFIDGHGDLVVIFRNQGADDLCVLGNILLPDGPLVGSSIHGQAVGLHHEVFIEADQLIVAGLLNEIHMEADVLAVELRIVRIVQILDFRLHVHQRRLGVGPLELRYYRRLDDLADLIDLVDIFPRERADAHPPARIHLYKVLALERQQSLANRRAAKRKLLIEHFFGDLLPGKIFAGKDFLQQILVSQFGLGRIVPGRTVGKKHGFYLSSLTGRP